MEEFRCKKDIASLVSKDSVIKKEALLDLFTLDGLQCLVHQGYLIEIPEFTRSDVIKFKCSDPYILYMDSEYIKTELLLNIFMKEKK